MTTQGDETPGGDGETPGGDDEMRGGNDNTPGWADGTPGGDDETPGWADGQIKVLPSFRPLINKYKFSYYDDVIQCYITGNNSQSYSGY